MTSSGFKYVLKRFSLGFIIFIALMLFNDLKKLGSLEDYETYDLNSDIDKLHLTLKKGGVNEYLLEKEIFKEKLIQLINSKTLNQSVKKDINSLMVFMFPYNARMNIIVNDKPLKSMTSIENFPYQFKAKREYRLLEREAYISHTGVFNKRLPLLHKKILKIYSDIAGVQSAQKTIADNKHER